eukprot:s3506_g5.t1
MQPQVARAFPAPRMECDSCAPRRRPCLKFFDGCGMLTGPGIQSMRIRRGRCTGVGGCSIIFKSSNARRCRNSGSEAKARGCGQGESIDQVIKRLQT